MANTIVAADVATTAANEHAITVTINNSVTVNPNVHVTTTGAGANAIYSGAGSSDVTIDTGADISSALANGIFLDVTNGVGNHVVSIASQASVSGGTFGVVMLGIVNTLKNAGTITGSTGAFIGQAGAFGIKIFQSGSIIGNTGNGLSVLGDAIINNTGLIHGALAAINVSGLATFAEINNYGHIVGGSDGAIIIAQPSSSSNIHNFGSIEGTINLSDVDDVYDGRQGIATGTIFLKSGDDRGYGGAGAETFNGGGGNDTIDGGGGKDLVLFSGARSDYDITHNVNGTITVADNRASTDGTDTLKNIRFAKFTDQTFTLHNDAPINLALSKTTFTEDTPVTGIVASLSAFDGDGDTLTYSLTANPSGLFRLDGANVVLTGAADFETLSQHSITVKATDAYGGEVTKTFTLDVTNVIETTALILRGTSSADSLTGESGSDMLYGGLSNDVLTGGQGKDIFVFDTKPSTKTNVDRIVDFNVTDDTIHLAKSIFSKIAKKGVLAKTAFWTGDKAHDADDRVIYNKKTGAVFYDSDGNGSHAAVQFATIAKNLKMTALDFYVM